MKDIDRRNETIGFIVSVSSVPTRERSQPEKSRVKGIISEVFIYYFAQT